MGETMSELGKACKFTITIEPSHNKGFLVKIGCATLTFHSKDALITALEKFLRDPEGWEKEYNKVCSGGAPEEAAPLRMEPTPHGSGDDPARSTS